MLKNKFKLTVKFADGGHKDFFIDEYSIDEFGMVTFILNGKEKKHHVSNVDIEKMVGDSS